MKARFFGRTYLCLTAVAVMTWACDSGEVVEPVVTPVLTSVTVSPAEVTIVMGQTRQLSAQALDQNGSAMSGTITFTWSSGDETVATVDATGLVTAVFGGTATITATTATTATVSGTATATVSTPITASDWVSAVNWDNATTVTVDMVENGAALSYSLSQSTFEAGKPYIIQIINPATNSSKHYFSPKDALGSFYQAVATRKVQTAEAEYKAPYFDAVELKIGGTLEFYFVPVLPGTYTIICTIVGHEAAGMTTDVTITGGVGYQLDLEVAADFNTALATDARKSGSHAVWTTALETTIAMVEAGADLSFAPPNLQLTQDQAYKLILDNPSGHASKHYYTAAEFYKTVVLRKADDSQAEIKAPYLKAVELLIGGNTILFIVPTVANTFEVLCTIIGHAAAGMRGDVVVSAGNPTTTSGWIDGSFVDWSTATTVDVDMVENGAALSFSLSQSTFEAGKPYIIRINNPATNTGKHYFSPKDALGSFYKAIATRKVQTGDAEYKAPYFDAVELKIGGTLELYFVPVLPGTYTIICTIVGHEAAGMTTEVTIYGDPADQLDLEVAADFDVALTTDARKSGSHAVWTTAADVSVDMEEAGSTLSFIPPNLALTRDVGYKLLLANASDHASKHYYTAAEFYKTVVLRKADDTYAEIKAPYLKAVELLIGGSTTLFVVPTVANTFDVLCTILGHAAAGMTGTIVVNP